MKVGVISDSHDNLPNLRYALRALGEQGIGVLFHCGDLISPFVTRELGQFAGAVHAVFGNNDGDRFLTLKLGTAAAKNVTHYGEFGFVTVEGHKIGFTHYHEYAKGFAAAGLCDAAFFGHTHQFHEERVGNVLVLNPGELLGLMGKPSFCVYETADRTFVRTVFDPQPWPV
jgi:uncharacterized protein